MPTHFVGIFMHIWYNTYVKRRILMNIKMTKLLDHVLDAGTYTSLNFEKVQSFLNSKTITIGGCSAIATITDDGKTLVGRNMDLNISHKSAYVIRTKVKGNYETIGLSYFYDIFPDYEDVLNNGMPEDLYNLLPFFSTDVLNEKGLYIETNMRTGECWSNGESKYGCSGTNKDAGDAIRSSILPRILCEHCATVDEAVAYVNNLNITIGKGNNTAWNFCFLMADATGNYGVLEVAANKVFWHEKTKAQTNFYLAKELNEIESYKAGLGRYDYLINNIDRVQNEDDMYELMKSVSYFQIYDPENCKFDLRSEFVGTEGHWTSDWLLDDRNKDELMAYINKTSSKIKAMTREEKQDQNKYWESAFTEVINCTDKTLFVRFYEDDERTLKLSF